MAAGSRRGAWVTTSPDNGPLIERDFKEHSHFGHDACEDFALLPAVEGLRFILQPPANRAGRHSLESVAVWRV